MSVTGAEERPRSCDAIRSSRGPIHSQLAAELVPAFLCEIVEPRGHVLREHGAEAGIDELQFEAFGEAARADARRLAAVQCFKARVENRRGKAGPLGDFVQRLVEIAVLAQFADEVERGRFGDRVELLHRDLASELIAEAFGRGCGRQRVVIGRGARGGFDDQKRVLLGFPRDRVRKRLGLQPEKRERLAHLRRQRQRLALPLSDPGLQRHVRVTRSRDAEALAQIDPADILIAHDLIGGAAHQHRTVMKDIRRDRRFPAFRGRCGRLISTPMPRVLRSWTSPRISPTEIGSTPAKGSSSRRYFGRAARQRAISTRRRSPPDSASAGARRRWVIENSDRSSSSCSRRLWIVALGDLEDREDVVFDG